jgi:hypothetical protein
VDLATPLRRRELCAERSQGAGEALGATASRADHWLLVEYRGPWAKDLLEGSLLSAELKEHLRATQRALPNTRLLFVRRTERRVHPRYHVVLGTTSERARRFHELEVSGHGELLDIDLAGALAGRTEPPGRPLDRPLYVVCTHGKRDRCCAKLGRPLFDELCRQVGPESAWQSTHVGGDRFAGNLVAFPHGLFFGHVSPENVQPILERLREGAIDLPHYRGRCCYPFAVQAAERAVREETGLLAIDALSFVRMRQLGPDEWQVRLAGPEGELYEVEVVTELEEEPVYLTCSSVTPQRFRRYVARGCRALAAR